MLRVKHSCGYSKDVNFICPKCGLPFCEEDTQQGVGGMLQGVIALNEDSINQKERIDLLEKKLNELSSAFDKIRKIVENCKQCNKEWELALVT